MYQDLKRLYWWYGMKNDVAKFVAKCLSCQQVKIEHQKPAGLLQPLEIPQWKWENITMDFVTGLPKTKGRNGTIWVIVDRLTKSAHFLPLKMGFEMRYEKLAELYIREIVRLHSVPLSIVSDRNPRFTSRFWKAFKNAMGTKVSLSSAYHPQTDGQSERTIRRILEYLLRLCSLDFKGNWDEHLPLVEFSYNNSYQGIIGMAPFEALYGRRCRTLLCWFEVGEKSLTGPEIVEGTTAKVSLIQKWLQAAYDRQKSCADKRRRDLHFEVGDLVFVKVSPMRGVLHFGKKGKLSPRYVGPFEIFERVGDVAYKMSLPPEMSALHDVFHIAMLRRYQPDLSHVIVLEPVEIRDDLSYEEKPV